MMNDMDVVTLTSTMTTMMNMTTVNMTTESDDNYVYDDSEQVINYILASIIGVCGFFGILGNSLVVITWAMSRKLQTITNIFVISLSITDFLGCSMLPIQVYTFIDFENGSPVPEWVCKMCGALCLIAFKSSVCHLALIGINRYVVITRFRAQYLRLYSVRNVLLMVIFAWTFPILAIMLPPAAGLGRLGYNAANQLCVFDGTPLQLRIIYILEEILFGLSLIIIVLCYYRIWSYVNRQHRDLIYIYSKRERSLTNNTLNIPSCITEVSEATDEEAVDQSTTTTAVDAEGSSTPPCSNTPPTRKPSTTDAPTSEPSPTEQPAIEPPATPPSNIRPPTTPPPNTSRWSIHSSASSMSTRSKIYAATDKSRVSQMARRKRAQSAQEMRTVLTKREIDITKNLFMVVCCFFFFVFPHILCLTTSKCYTTYFKYTATILVINSMTNPLIYCLKHPTFREVSSCLFKGDLSRIPQPARWLKRFLHR